MPPAAESRNASPPTPHRATFEAEVRQAVQELGRPAGALFASAALAGASIGFVVLLLGSVLALQDWPLGPLDRLAVGGIYSLGFILAILARTDLFTEYTTVAIFPLLAGRARLAAVARLWAWVYAGNMAGVLAVSVVGTLLGPSLDIFSASDIARHAGHLTRHAWWVIVLSGAAAGWLMGLLSWLIAGGRDSTSQIIFIATVGILIGFLGLHHAITGAAEVMVAVMGRSSLTAGEALHMMVWTTLGNSVGGIAFALVVSRAVRVGPGGDREEPRQKGEPRSRRESER